MRPASVHILFLLLVLPCLLAGCAQRGRVIPEEKMSRIYEDMLLADQWLRDHPDSRKAADTTLFFDPIFKRYGYSFEDFDRSVNYYVDHPEQYTKILTGASERLSRENERLQQLRDARIAAEQERDRLHALYKSDWNFSDDSLRWAQDRILWPVRDTAVRDTAARDSLARPDSLALAESARKPAGRLLDSLARQENNILTK